MFTQKATLLHACHLATSNSVKLHKLRKLIALLSEEEGREKEFVSLYIPTSTTLDTIVAMLRKETDAMLPKSELAKDRIQEVVKSVIQNLKQLKEIPDNGLAVFAGVRFADNEEGKTLEFREVLPPQPITKYLYEIDSHFQLEPLREMLRYQKIVGIMALDSKEASFGILNGDRLEILERITSGVPGKSGKGGQSQRRYEREREMEISYFFHRIAEHAARAFLENHQVTVLIVGGPGPTKDDFLRGKYLHYELENALLKTVDTQSAGSEGVTEAVNKSSEELKNLCTPEEKGVMQRLLGELGKQNGLAIYGLDLVSASLKRGEVEIALLTDNTNTIEYVATCKKCGLSKKMITDKKDSRAIQAMNSTPCVRCGSTQFELEEKDIVDTLEDAASETDATIEVISAESDEKTKLTALGGFAALLRYKTRFS